MTFHVYSQWALNDPIEDAPIKDIAYGIKVHNYAQPLCYGVFTFADSCILNITLFLARHRGEVITQELVEAFVDEAAQDVMEYRDKIVQVVTLVLQELELFNEAFTEDKKQQVHFEHSEQFKKAEAELAADPAFNEAVSKIVKDLKKKGKSSGIFETLPGVENLGDDKYGVLKDKITKGLYHQPGTNDDVLRN